MAKKREKKEERKRAEEAYRALVDHSLQGLVIFQENGVVFANPAMAEMTGYSLEELLSLSPDDIQGIVHPDDRERVWRNIRDRLTGKPVPPRQDFRFIGGEGTVRWAETLASHIEYQGKPALQVAFLDITERKRAEEELRQSEERYRRIVETAHEGIWIIDSESKTIFANSRMAEMLGYTTDEMIGKSLFEFMDEEWQAIAQVNVDRRRQGVTEQHDFKFRRKDSTDLWAIVTTNPFLDEDGRYTGALGMITDITKRKRAEEELRRYSNYLENLFAASPDAIVVSDLDQNIIDCNQAALDLLRLSSKEELIGKSGLPLSQRKTLRR